MPFAWWDWISMCTALFNKLCLFLSLPSSHPIFFFPFPFHTPFCPCSLHANPISCLSFSLTLLSVHFFRPAPHPVFPWVTPVPPLCGPVTRRGSSDTVCSPHSARLLLYSGSGLEIPHHPCLPPSHHGLLPRPPEPAERLHRGLLRPAARGWHWQVWPAPPLHSPVLKEQVMEEDHCTLYQWMMMDCWQSSRILMFFSFFSPVIVLDLFWCSHLTVWCAP